MSNSNINLICDNCGKEIKGGAYWTIGEKLCAKCYHEMNGNPAGQYIDMLHKEMYELKIADLEAKLAESEKKNFELITKLNLKEHRPVFCTLADRECEALGQVEELKQQLDEKEKEIDFLKTQSTKYLEKGMLIVRYEDLWAIDEKHNQDKISFAVAYLELLKAFIIDKEFYFVGEDYSTVYVEDITEEIDNQIAELKKGVK